MSGFYVELKRRNVLRVGAAYLVFSWLVLQVVDLLGPILALPEWLPRVTLLLLAIGFVAALVLSWVYELTPEGIRLLMLGIMPSSLPWWWLWPRGVSASRLSLCRLV